MIVFTIWMLSYWRGGTIQGMWWKDRDARPPWKEVEISICAGGVEVNYVRTREPEPTETHIRWFRMLFNKPEGYGVTEVHFPWRTLGFEMRRRPLSWDGVEYFWSVVVPAYALVLASGAMPAVQLTRLIRRRRRIRLGRCPRCGYDLRGSGGTCPECGAEAIKLNTGRAV